jgi:hypothetical protein
MLYCQIGSVSSSVQHQSNDTGVGVYVVLSWFCLPQRVFATPQQDTANTAVHAFAVHHYECTLLLDVTTAVY